MTLKNDPMVTALSSHFQRRYEAAFARSNAHSHVEGMPGIRGFWPLSNFLSTGDVVDMGGRDYDLIRAGNPLYNYQGLVGYLAFDGTGDYCSKADAGAPDLDITATESYVAAAARGLTLGCWVRPEDNTTTQQVMSKWYTVGQYSYLLSLAGAVANDPVRFRISDDGTNFDTADSTGTYALNTWQFIAGRFSDNDTGEELAVWLNDVKTTAASARAAIFNGTDAFAIGGAGNGTNLMTGRVALAWISCMALSDAAILTVYHQTRALFGM